MPWDAPLKSFIDSQKSIKPIPLRPIVSSRGSVTYGVTKVLAKILKPLVVKSLHHIQSTKDFVDRVSEESVFALMMLLHCLLLCQWIQLWI